MKKAKKKKKKIEAANPLGAEACKLPSLNLALFKVRHGASPESSRG